MSKLDDLEKMCLSITKEDIGPYFWPPEDMFEHILNLLDDDDHRKLGLIEKICESIRQKGYEEQELIWISNSISDMSKSLFDDDDNPFN